MNWRLLAKLDNTVIVYTSDHGFVGSHRVERKHLPYEEVIRIPLVIRRPGQNGNQVIPEVVSNVDLAPTIAALAGVTPGLSTDGRSLLLLMDREPGWTSCALIEKHPDSRDPGEFYGCGRATIPTSNTTPERSNCMTWRPIPTRCKASTTTRPTPGRGKRWPGCWQG